MAETAPTSALAAALERVGDRWTLLVIEALLAGPMRFGDVQAELAGIAPNILTQRLRHLEREALVFARPYSERPRRFEYELTESGRELAGALRLLADWGGRGSTTADPLTHGVCGTPLEARWFCPTCHEPVDEAEVADAEFL